MQPEIDVIHSAEDAKVVVGDIKQDLKAIKAGYKTTEFWAHLFVQLALWVNASNNTSKVQAATMVVSGTVASIYAVLRTYLKVKLS